MIYSTTKKDDSNRRENNEFLSMAQKPHRKLNQQKSKHQNWNAIIFSLQMCLTSILSILMIPTVPICNSVACQVFHSILLREKKTLPSIVHQRPATRPTKLHLIEYLLQFFPFVHVLLWRYTKYASCMCPPIQRTPPGDSSLDFRCNMNATTWAPFANASHTKRISSDCSSYSIIGFEHGEATAKLTIASVKSYLQHVRASRIIVYVCSSYSKKNNIYLKCKLFNIWSKIEWELREKTINIFCLSFEFGSRKSCSESSFTSSTDKWPDYDHT